jgi:NDP-sugar pyrophosphorylase family protein
MNGRANGSMSNRRNGARPNGARPNGARKAVILAGGRGTRLAPYTSVLPKPLMPIGDRSILEIVVGQLADHGLNDITFCVGYLSHLIRAVFDSRHDDGRVRITYVQEESALGTAAPLRLVDGLDDSFILMNGDVLTNLDYGDLVGHHKASGNLLTVATRERTIKINYGVVHVGNNGSASRVEAWEEKPEVVSHVSMGIYVLEPRALEYIPPEGYFDFPELVAELLAREEPVGVYPYDGLWFDIGRADDYQSAVEAWCEDPISGNGHREQAAFALKAEGSR